MLPPDALTATPRPSIRRNVIANYAGQGVASLTSLLLVPVYIGYLGIEAWALVGLFAVIQAWMAMLDMGMAPTLGRETARFSAGTRPAQSVRDLLRSLEVVYLGLAIGVAVALTLFADVVARQWLRADALPVATVAGALSMLGIVVAMRFCEGLYRSGIMGLQQQVWLGGVSVALTLLRSFGALAVLALVSPTVQAFFVWQGLVSLLTLVVLGARLHRALPPGRAQFSMQALKSISGFAGGIFATTLLTLLMGQFDKLLLSRLVPLADLGVYMLASTIAGGLWLVGGPVVLAVAPAFVARLEAGESAGLAAVYHRAARLVTIVLAPAALLMMVFPYGLLFAWSGDAVLAARAAPILALLAAGTFFNALYQVPHHLQTAAGWTGLTLRLSLVAVVAMVPAMLWAVPAHGPVGAAAVWAAVNLLFVGVGVPLQHRRLLPGGLWRWWRSDVLVPFGLAAAVMAMGWVLRPAPGAGRWEWLAFCLVAGGLSFAAAALSATGGRRDRSKSHDSGVTGP